MNHTNCLQSSWSSLLNFCSTPFQARYTSLFTPSPLALEAPLYSKNEFIASNIPNDPLGQARIIYIMWKHWNSAVEKRLNNELIERCYKKGDIILVEYRRDQKPAKENLRSIDRLDPSRKYTVRGWDDPAPYKEFLEKGGKDWSLAQKEQFVFSSWKIRQESLQRETKKALSFFRNNRVFVLMGSLHWDNNNPEMTPTAKQFLPQMGYPFVIVDFRARSAVQGKI